MSLSPNGLDKLREMQRLAGRAYYSASILDEIVSLRDFEQGDIREFQQLAYRPRLEAEMFNDPATVMDLVFGEIGRSIALSEERAIVTKIAELTVQGSPANDNFVAIVQAVTRLLAEGGSPSLILAPVDYYMTWHWDWATRHSEGPGFRFIQDSGRSYLQVGSFPPIRVRWSNKYVPFDDFYVIDRGWGEWVAKPDRGHRFQVRFLERNELDYAYKVVFRLDIIDPSRVLRIIPNRIGLRQRA